MARAGGDFLPIFRFSSLYNGDNYKALRNKSRSGKNWSDDHSRDVKFIFYQRCAAQGHYAAMIA
jgi:hypothetical protein